MAACFALVTACGGGGSSSIMPETDPAPSPAPAPPSDSGPGPSSGSGGGPGSGSGGGPGSGSGGGPSGPSGPAMPTLGALIPGAGDATEQLPRHTYAKHLGSDGYVRISYNDRDSYNNRVGLANGNDYVTFGYWLQESKFNSGQPFMAIPFATVSTVYGGSDTTLKGNTGTAEYKGPAVGLFVRNGQDGRFKADATITMNFGTDKISGTVDSFEDIAGNESIGDWTVPLPSTNLAVRFSGRSSSVNWMGVIGSRVRPSNASIPTGVAGTFDATFSDGSVRGAFGARDD